ncbi:16S rRNA (cytosine(1402)-N(4))-methyltransferase RsmH [Dokdonella fugitiva]|jgi:16S rRNA (cytosine1402-N4)-methyltransferase|uniref:Ribosomal RNA small subunit methyltransferase H n=1 Tax=Dokdonella fugitiva TaxID=328517 RepID=A0A4R2IIY5_9GAMM|nr:16S rRNA (cytosine(1402)-N(4))-methyltransferase RsmH [Dokdonella fugitiva]MBA8882527.1 16S rRNA (cytosine1402-N4)-methyltransferase [Dokdonella fugitiva]TCO42675.1 16S rRNA (cytosine1402-N4)-methyltransferase [Dokdonella fugitiva]
MSASQLRHVPVMLAEVLEGLRVREKGSWLDGTFGRGGHAREVLKRLGPEGRLLLMDRDPEAIAAAQAEFAHDPRVAIRHANFAGMDAWPEAAAGLDGVLLDLGVSSPQLDDPQRGFSFQSEGPLDMRMDPTRGTSAAQWLATADEKEIADVLWRHGEERMSRRIARAIVERERERPLATTRDLADLVARTIGHRERNKHPATRTFQALRIHVNDEFGALERGLDAALRCLKPGGRLAVISFHSLEDRVVKQFIRGEVARPVRRGLPLPEVAPPALVAIGKAQFAGEAELAANPRARSAVLRVAEKRADPPEAR